MPNIMDFSQTLMLKLLNPIDGLGLLHKNPSKIPAT
jgi:hypothetical protein